MTPLADPELYCRRHGLYRAEYEGDEECPYCRDEYEELTWD